ncbi:MAG TPA: chaplin, partial [Mycobacterium sp.]|nr:chaplin [Mycobacterium sp.]
MHYSTKRRVVLGMTTGGLLMTGLGMASAHADTTATGETSHSPGIGSGNLIQLPVNAPINVCGNQIDVIGILDSVTGNSCSNGGGSAAGGSNGGTSASGDAKHSPGIGSGNLVQIPINAPVNVCGNQVDVIGVGNTDHGNSCSNGGSGST